MQVIGLCRFSWPAYGGFQIEHETIEDRIAYLYAPDRMEERFRTFEAFTLPSIRAQTDPEFTFLIVVGEAMPGEMLSRLKALVKDVPQVIIKAMPPGRHRKTMQEAFNSVRVKSDLPCLQFRLDDDDAVCTSFVEDLRMLAGRLTGMLDLYRHIAIDFNQGFILSPDGEGLRGERVTRTCWTPALAVMLRPGVNLSVMNFAHNKLQQKMPTLSVPGVDMMVRCYNGFNDSRQGKNVATPNLHRLDEAEETHIRETFGIDADHVRTLFSGG